MADLINVIDRLSRRLGTVGGDPVPLDGGITNRNFRVRFGGRDCVLRLPGRDTELLGIDRAADADPGHAVLVDWEYAGMGHRYFDLGNLAVNNDFDEPAQERLLRAYLGQPPRPGQSAALHLMMLVSDAREAAWGVVQGSIS